MGNKIGPAVRKSCVCCRSAPKTIEKKYSVLETDLLGEGTFAKVFKGTNRKTKQEVAVKVVDKAKQRSDLLDTEIWILQTFGNHPNIVNFYDIYETETEVKLVIEFMAGGELFDLLDENGPYGEADAAKHLRAVASGLAYLHAGNVVHRDLKPENLLLTSKGPEGILKIADFGLSKILIDEELIKVACGTWIYCAPEVLSLKQGHLGQYGTQSDVFSLGCIIFLIMGGYHPFDFDGNDDEELMQECILSETWDFDDPAWEEVSHQAKDLIEQMLKYKPQDRISAAELAAHPWATGHVSYGRLSQSIDKNLKKTRASLRNNKLEGAEMVRKSLDATAAEICKVVVQDADSAQQARAAPDLPELQDLAPTIAPQAGGGALRVPCRRMSQNSNNSKSSNKSTRSCPGRRKAAAVQEDAVKEDVLPKGNSGHAGRYALAAGSLALIAVSIFRWARRQQRAHKQEERHAVLSCIRTRRSIFPRDYVHVEVDPKVVTSLLEAAIWAPFHGPRAPWRFLVLGRTAMVQMQKITLSFYDQNWRQTGWGSGENGSESDYLKWRAMTEEEITGRWGPVSYMIAIIMQRQAHPEKRMPEWEEAAATACAVQNMYIQATEFQGLACYWSSWHDAARDSPEMHDFLGMGVEDKCMGFFIVASCREGLKDRRRRCLGDFKIEWRA